MQTAKRFHCILTPILNSLINGYESRAPAILLQIRFRLWHCGSAALARAEQVGSTRKGTVT